MIINIENLIKICFKKKQNSILKIRRIKYMLKIKRIESHVNVVVLPTLAKIPEACRAPSAHRHECRDHGKYKAREDCNRGWQVSVATLHVRRRPITCQNLFDRVIRRPLVIVIAIENVRSGSSMSTALGWILSHICRKRSARVVGASKPLISSQAHGDLRFM